MRFWYQNLNENYKHMFHFRGSLSTDKNPLFKFEVCSGPSIYLKYRHGDRGDAASQIIFGLFVLTIYFTFYLPQRFYFKKKCTASWDNNREFYLIEGREYGFYVSDWNFVWSFHAKCDESSSSDPWWMRKFIRLDELAIGKVERIVTELEKSENILFKIGTKEFKMDSIKWERVTRIRRFIPYSLWHHTSYFIYMKIDKPPMYSGKGENSYDCGDDGTYGLSRSWTHEIPNWTNKEACTKKAIDLYISHVMKDAKRYGGSSSENGIRAGLPYEYVGAMR